MTGSDLAVALASDASDTNFTILGTEPLVHDINVEEFISPGDVIRGESNSALYYVAEDYRRRPFFNETIYFTWYTDFDQVNVISDDVLDAVKLGSPMLPKPGIVLIKSAADARVYVVEEHPLYSDRGIKRWVSSENLAIQLFGTAWSDYVIDLPADLFVRFDDGSDVSESDVFDSMAMMKRLSR